MAFSSDVSIDDTRPGGARYFAPRKQRFHVSVRLLYRLFKEAWKAGTVLNVSASGVLFRGERKDIELGTVIELTIRMPDSTRKIAARGRVVRIELESEENSARIAVAFLRARILRCA